MSGIMNVFRRIASGLSRQQLVGKDRAGNCYYKKIETDFSGHSFERRQMVPGDRGNHITYDPKTVPPQWRQWLSKTRDEPPSEEELTRDNDRLTQLQARVIELQADEQRRRMQAESTGQEPKAAEGPSLDRFLGQLSNKGYTVEKDGAATGTSDQSKNGKPKASSKDFEPEAWQPGG